MLDTPPKPPEGFRPPPAALHVKYVATPPTEEERALEAANDARKEFHTARTSAVMLTLVVLCCTAAMIVACILCADPAQSDDLLGSVLTGRHQADMDNPVLRVQQSETFCVWVLTCITTLLVPLCARWWMDVGRAEVEARRTALDWVKLDAPGVHSGSSCTPSSDTPEAALPDDLQ